jgi:hypothetical protein
MTYITGDVPVGNYNSSSLANIGIGHGAVDVGGGYTYFDPQTGHELSAVLGFTYNMINPSTQYQNGIDMHLDWGASQFLTQQVQIGLVGYFYDQLSCDSGSGDHIGCFESRVAGIGPQVGYLFPVGGMQGYLNLKTYAEFDGSDRPSGWNAWVTFAISPVAPTPTTPMSASLIGRSGSSTFRLSTTAVSMSLAGSCFSSESAPGPFHHGIRGRGGTIFWAALPSV